MAKRLVVFGASNILSDVFDCAARLGVAPGKVVLHLPEPADDRSIPLSRRVEQLAALGTTPVVETLDSFRPSEDELYLLGPTTPSRVNLAAEVQARFGLRFASLVHPGATVSALAVLSPGCFVGAGSVIAPGAHLGEHVFVNRCASIGHDTQVGSFTRIQPGAHAASLSRIGRGVSIGIGACLVDRLTVGDNTVIGAGSVVVGDLPGNVVAWGNPAEVRRAVDNPFFHDAG